MNAVRGDRGTGARANIGAVVDDRTLNEVSLPWPPQWHRAPLGGWLVPLASSVAVVFLGVAAVLAAVQGKVVAGVGVGVVAVAFVPIAVNSRPRKPWTKVESVGTEVEGVRSTAVRFPVRPSPPIVNVSLLVLGAAFLALAVAAMVIAIVRGEGQLVIGFVVLGGIGSVLFLGGIAGLFSSRAGIGIDLTPQHVVIGLGATPKVLAWDDIEEIGATSISYGVRPLRPVQNWVTIVTKEPDDVTARLVGRSNALGRLAGRVSGNVAAAVPEHRLRNDPGLVYHGLRYYLAHPDLRAELATGAAVRRLQSGPL